MTTPQEMYGMPEYRAAVAGIIPEPSEERRAEVRQWVPNLDELLEAAVPLIWEAPTFSRKDNPKPRGWKSAYKYVWQNMEIVYPERAKYREDRQKRHKDLMHLRVLTLASDIARTSPLAWGVQDPEQEAYCSCCKEVVPLTQFTEGYATCEPCLESRRRQS